MAAKIVGRGAEAVVSLRSLNARSNGDAASVQEYLYAGYQIPDDFDW